jgi:polar amino acid transport system ATP-binding protein
MTETASPAGDREAAASPPIVHPIDDSQLGATIVQAEGVHKFYGDNHVLRGMDLTVRQKEAVMLVGRSGSGKTTFLRCLNFLEEPTMGSVEIDGLRVDADPIHARSKAHQEQMRLIRMRACMVFQEFNLFPHMTVLDNCVEAPVRVKGDTKAQAVARAEGFLAKVGLGDKRDEYPARLSGGQKQRVAIARALCMEPKVLLFDEPTSALDPELIGEVLRVMEDLAHEGATMIVVTHEMHFAREAADRVLFLEGGRIIEDGPPEKVLDDPADDRTRQFLRRFLAN